MTKHRIRIQHGAILAAAGDHWDGTSSMKVLYNDGGRGAAGFAGHAGDCVARSIAIASGRPYQEVYDVLAAGNAEQRVTKHSKRNAGKRTASSGVYVRRKWFKDRMAAWGFTWTPTMQIGSGCKVHLLEGELPSGRLVVAVSKHYTVVIDGVVHDTHDPHRATIWTKDGVQSMSHRCVYGYWTFQGVTSC